MWIGGVWVCRKLKVFFFFGGLYIGIEDIDVYGDIGRGVFDFCYDFIDNGIDINCVYVCGYDGFEVVFDIVMEIFCFVEE